MGKDKKSMFDFEDLGNTDNINTENNNAIYKNKSNNKIIDNNDSLNRLHETEQLKETLNNNNMTEQKIVSYKQFKKSKPKTVEETHTRDTVLVENGLLKKINALAKKNGKGYKKWFYNTALEMLLKKIKEEE